MRLQLNRRAILLSVGAFVPLLTPGNIRSNGTTIGNPCGSSNFPSQNLISFIQGVITGTDSLSLKYQANLNLPAGNASSVTLVSDSATCWRARSAYVAFLRLDTLSIPVVYTVKVGSGRFVVSDLVAHRPAYWSLSAVTDSSFKYLAGFNG